MHKVLVDNAQREVATQAAVAISIRDEFMNAPEPKTNVSQTSQKGSRRRPLWARFARNRKGALAIEFAMVSIPLLGLICAIFETAFVFFTQEAFDNAVSNVARQVLINTYTSNSTPLSSSFLTSAFCPQLPSFITCSKVVLNVNTEASFNASAMNQTWWNSASYTGASSTVNLGQPGQIVIFQAFYPMPVYLSVLTATGMGGGSVSNLYSHTSNTVFNNPTGPGFVHAIFSTAVFRNEPT
jgi:Flp pilus assembly protein TadG